jgi:hypothetical protein
LDGIYNIQVGPGIPANTNKYSNFGDSSNYSKITFPNGTIYQTSGVAPYDGTGGSSVSSGNGYSGRHGYNINDFGAGGGSGAATNGATGGSGGNYGGGNGGSYTSWATAGAANTGSGGGGGAKQYYQNGAAGGSGVVYIILPANKFSYTGSYVEVTNFGD